MLPAHNIVASLTADLAAMTARVDVLAAELTAMERERDAALTALVDLREEHKIAVRTVAAYVADSVELRQRAARFELENQELRATVAGLTVRLLGYEMQPVLQEGQGL